MFCKFCGKELNENARFCASCGKQIDETVEGVSEPVKVIVVNEQIKTNTLCRLGIIFSSISIIPPFWLIFYIPSTVLTCIGYFKYKVLEPKVRLANIILWAIATFFLLATFILGSLLSIK